MKQIFLIPHWISKSFSAFDIYTHPIPFHRDTRDRWTGRWGWTADNERGCLAFSVGIDCCPIHTAIVILTRFSFIQMHSANHDSQWATTQLYFMFTNNEVFSLNLNNFLLLVLFDWKRYFSFRSKWSKAMSLRKMRVDQRKC